MTTKLLAGVATLLVVVAVGSAQPPAPQPTDLGFEDQFDRKPRLADLRGRVVVLVYGDRKGTDACRQFGELIHVTFHPTAKGLPPGKAREQPAAAVPGLKPGLTAPGVTVVPVACCGKLPAVVRTLIRSQVKAGSPDVPVWLDFEETMAKHFGLTTGQVNVAVFDAAGVFRHGLTGTPDAKKTQELAQVIQTLRAEAAK